MPKMWTVDEITPRLAALDAKVDARLTAITHYVARDMEGYARTNAPWKDRTGNARNGLTGTPDVVPLKEYKVILHHSMPYGIWLEIRWSGRYSIIMPTIVHEIPKIRQLISGMMAGLR